MRLLSILTLVVLLTAAPLRAQEAQETAVQPAVLPTVTIEAKIVQIVLNDEHRQGVDWEAIVSDFHTLALKKEGLVSWSDKKYTLSVGEVSADDYEVLLDALDTVGHVSQKDFTPFTIQKDEVSTQDLSVDIKDIPSIKLDLTWMNSPSGESKIKIAPAIGMLAKENNTLNALAVYKEETELNLSDERTIVIGGLMREDEITKMHKFPLLGDLPLVGLVFRKQGRLMQKTETIIFLTVHMTKAPLAAEEQK